MSRFCEVIYGRIAALSYYANFTEMLSTNHVILNMAGILIESIPSEIYQDNVQSTVLILTWFVIKFAAKLIEIMHNLISYDSHMWYNVILHGESKGVDFGGVAIFFGVMN